MAVSFDRKAVIACVPVRKFNNYIFYVHGDQFVGINLNDGKLEDQWKVSFSGNSASFSNDSLKYILNKP